MEMLPLSTLLFKIATWLAISSAKGALLVAAVVLLRRLLTPVVASEWRHLLWLPVFACLLCPFGPNLPLIKVLQSDRSPQMAAPAAPPSSQPGGARIAGALASQASPMPMLAQPLAAPTTASSLTGSAGQMGDSHLSWFVLLWTVGAGVLATLYAANFIRFRRLKRGARKVQGTISRVFEDCQAEQRVRQVIRLLESGDIDSPTVVGWWRPVLLVPLDLDKRLDAAGLRYVLLHELEHVKRHDVLLNWIAALAQLLHWFNPAVWIATRLMRSDMEVACDASVLGHLSRSEREEYGGMLVCMADSHAVSSQMPYALGVADRISDLKGRLIMIARFRIASVRVKLATTLALVPITCAALIQPGFSSPAGASANATPDKLTSVTAAPPADNARDNGVPMRQLIEQVAANIHKRVIVDPDAASRVILYGQGLNQITYADFLTILRINGFTAVDVNNYVNVVSIRDVRTLPLPTMTGRTELLDDQFANMSIELKNACAPALVPLFRPWMPNYAYLGADTRSNTLIAIDTYANLKRVRSMVAELDAKTKQGLRCDSPDKGASPKAE